MEGGGGVLELSGQAEHGSSRRCARQRRHCGCHLLVHCFFVFLPCLSISLHVEFHILFPLS